MKKLSLVFLYFFFLAGCQVKSVVCSPDLLVAPMIVSPIDKSVTQSLSPVLEWTYPEVKISDTKKCLPEEFHVSLMDYPFHYLHMEWDVPGTQFSLVTDYPFEVGQQYIWRIYALTNDIAVWGKDHYFSIKRE